MTEFAPTVGLGEPAPWFSAARDAQGGEFVVIDELAGRHMVIFLFGSAEEACCAKALQALEGAEALFDGKRCVLVAVGADREDFVRRRLPTGGPGRLYLLDEGANVARLYGVLDATAGRLAVRPFAFVLNPMMQVIHVAPLDDAESFVTRIAGRLTPSLAAPVEPGAAPALLVPGVFDRDFCRRLVELYDSTGGRESGAIEDQGEIVQRFDQKFRQRLDHYIADPDVLADCRTFLSRRLLPMIYRAFQFKTTRIERYMVGRYSAGAGYFRPHRDNTAPIVAHRRFALTIVLNDEFEGGELTFPEFGSRAYRPAPGDAVVFSCAVLHEVMPVTRGHRYAFISFLYDEASQRLREDFIRQNGGDSGAQRP